MQKQDINQFKQWISNLQNEGLVKTRADTFFQDYYAFESLKHHDPETVTNFQKIVVQSVIAYKHFLSKVEREDLWDKYFSSWAEEILNGR